MMGRGSDSALKMPTMPTQYSYTRACEVELELLGYSASQVDHCRALTLARLLVGSLPHIYQSRPSGFSCPE